MTSLVLEPIKKWLYSPTIEFDFPIGKNTDLQDSSTTAYTPLMVISKNPLRPLEKLEEKIAVRVIIQNNSKLFTAEGCRVFLTSIKTRDNPEQEWKATEYKENNQVAWAEKQFEFEALDIPRKTSRAIELLILSRYSPEVRVRIPEIHFSFSYLFHSKTPKGKGWKFALLAVGKNISPTSFELILESPWKESLGVGMPLFQINGCPLEFNKLYLRTIVDPISMESMRGQDFSLGGDLS
ncbi:MAG: hypothetical protein C75L2_00550058 [Leptospirillum sp. Group II 'C75']|nr:MAG: hypothetical protein C75L2_00550058 [Leptospirillum sp. Group II 'C75']